MILNLQFYICYQNEYNLPWFIKKIPCSHHRFTIQLQLNNKTLKNLIVQLKYPFGLVSKLRTEIGFTFFSRYHYVRSRVSYSQIIVISISFQRALSLVNPSQHWGWSYRVRVSFKLRSGAWCACAGRCGIALSARAARRATTTELESRSQ